MWGIRLFLYGITEIIISLPTKKREGDREYKNLANNVCWLKRSYDILPTSLSEIPFDTEWIEEVKVGPLCGEFGHSFTVLQKLLPRFLQIERESECIQIHPMSFMG